VKKQSLIPLSESTELHSIDLVAADLVFKLNRELQAVKTLANPYTCEERYLPFLAHAFKVDFWDANLTLRDKRALISSSLMLHQKKGTRWAIERVFEALSIDAEILEWFVYEGEPYHFKVDIEVWDLDRRVSREFLDDLRKYIDIYKNVRSVLDELNIRLQDATGRFEFAGAATLSAKLENELSLDYESSAAFESAGANVINLKLENQLTLDEKAVKTIRTSGGVMNVRLSNETGIDHPQTDIKIQGVGIWAV